MGTRSHLDTRDASDILAPGCCDIAVHRMRTTPAIHSFVSAVSSRASGRDNHTMSTPRHPCRTRAAVAVGAILLALVTVLIDAPAAASPSRPASPPNAEWRWPLDGGRTITRAFEAPAEPWGSGHRGIDAAASEGQQVRAPADGVVFFAGVVVDRPVITVAHSGDVLSSFEAVRASVEEGESVERGQVIGTVSAGPHCDANCLHIGVRVHGEYVNPLIFFGGIERAVLLPLAGSVTLADVPADSFL
ncbi:peptidase M23-like protein [Paramicrobacterium agarici]|nr:peptidase M23-like protein [Microbacterium agarici]